jgi:hypothetical protein
MRSMRSMRGGFIFRSRGPLQKVCLQRRVTHESVDRVEHSFGEQLGS